MQKCCVIVGAGPSLLKTNLDIIPEDAYLMACNHFYKIQESFTRKADAIVITDSIRLQEVGSNYSKFEGDFFIGHQKYIYPPVEKIEAVVKRKFSPIKQLPKNPLLKRPFLHKLEIHQTLHDLIFDKRKWCTDSIDLTGCNFGSSVIFAASQIAISKGYNKIIFVGVDASYDKGKYAYSIGDKDYLNEAFMSNPRLNIEPYLVSMQIFYEPLGVEFIDCTVDGNLKFIKKSTLEKEFLVS